MASRTALSAAASAFYRSATASKPVPRRGFSAGGHHGPQRVNIWDDPLSPSKWKEEHFVLASLTGWGVVFYGAYKFFAGGKKAENKEQVLAEAKH